MSGYRGPGGDRGPGSGYYSPADDGPSRASTPASRGGNLPVWALALITVGSGLLTLAVLGLVVLVLCSRRRARREAGVRRDLEVQAALQSEDVRMLGRAEAKEAEEHAMRCESDAGEDLTFVVMAGEDHPSYLARPVGPVALTTPSPPSGSEPGQVLQPASGPPPVATAGEDHQKSPRRSPSGEST